ncbi:MAG: methyltransferase domain-containing protein [Steroidobacteraceae bacterium]
MDSQGRPSSHGKLTRILIDPTFRKRAIRYALGLPTPLDTEDRRVLERIIFEHYLSQSNVQTILFVGVEWYTKHYEKSYFGGRTLWTIDVNPEVRKFGARQHLTCALEDVEPHFNPGYFDLIICSGVYGFGLDTPAQCERAFGACYTLLRPAGHFVLGWNDVPGHRPVLLPAIESLSQFKPCQLPPLQAHRYLTNTPLRHTYQFYEREY